MILIAYAKKFSAKFFSLKNSTDNGGIARKKRKGNSGIINLTVKFPWTNIMYRQVLWFLSNILLVLTAGIITSLITGSLIPVS